MKRPRLKDLKETLARLACEGLDSPARAASSAALGVFCGIAPVWGFQLALALLAASAFRLNRLIAGAASNISVPPMIPFIVYASYSLGGLVTGRQAQAGPAAGAGVLRAAAAAAPQYLVGSLLLALLCGLCAWVLVYGAALYFPGKRTRETDV